LWGKRKFDKFKNPTKRVSKSLRRGAINWEPPFPEGEDEISMNLHQDFIKDQWKRKTPDMSKIKQRMVVTFPHRRKLINNKQPLSIIKEEYPALFTYNEVSHGLITQTHIPFIMSRINVMDLNSTFTNIIWYLFSIITSIHIYTFRL
jgi:hypothetical protein